MEPWTLLFAALGVAIFLEGLPYFISPGSVRQYMMVVTRMSDAAMRTTGLLLMLAGLAVAYISLH